MISNPIKGVGNLDLDRKSRKPKYTDTVLDALAELHPPSSLLVMDLSVKTLSLVAIATISRASTLNIMSREIFMMENDKKEGFCSVL